MIHTTLATIQATAEYRKIKCPVKQRFITNRHTRNVIDHGITISKNRGFDYWEKNYSASETVRNIVKELI